MEVGLMFQDENWDLYIEEDDDCQTCEHRITMACPFILALQSTNVEIVSESLRVNGCKLKVTKERHLKVVD